MEKPSSKKGTSDTSGGAQEKIKKELEKGTKTAKKKESTYFLRPQRCVGGFIRLRMQASKGEGASRDKKEAVKAKWGKDIRPDDMKKPSSSGFLSKKSTIREGLVTR